jgi:hypothetical protein
MVRNALFARVSNHEGGGALLLILRTRPAAKFTQAA